MEAIADSDTPTVEERLASAPEPPRTTFGLQLKSKVNFLATFVKPNKPKAVNSSELHIIRPRPKQDLEAATGVTAETTIQPVVSGTAAQSSTSQPDASPATYPVATTAPLDETIDQCQTQSSTTADDTLLTTKTHGTSQTSVDLEASFTRVQGYWVSSKMPEKELQALWIEKIQKRLAMELLASVRTGGWVLEFCLIGKAHDDLKPYIVVTCIEKKTKWEVEKVCKSFLWLRETMKRHRIRLITFHATTRLSAAFGRAAHEYLGIMFSGNPRTYCGGVIPPPLADNGPYCTLGGLIMVDGIVFALTAGHASLDHRKVPSALNTEQTNPSRQPNTGDHADTDSSSSPKVFDEDGEISDSSPPSSTSLGEISDHADMVMTVSPMLTDLFHARWRDVVWRSSTSHKTSDDATSEEPSVESPFQYLDWATTALPPDQPVLANLDAAGNFIDEIADIQEETRTVSVLQEGARGREGLLHPLPVTLKIGPYMHGVAYRISMKALLAPGFSGAWVLLDGKVCGIIVAVREDVPWVYMQPMKSILQDIGQKMMAQNVGILPRDHLSIPKNIFGDVTRSGVTMALSGSHTGKAYADGAREVVAGLSFSSAQERFQRPVEIVLQDSPQTSLDLSLPDAIRLPATPQIPPMTGSSSRNFPTPSAPQSVLRGSGKERASKDDTERFATYPETNIAQLDLEHGLEPSVPRFKTGRVQVPERVSVDHLPSTKIILNPIYHFEMFVLWHEFNRKIWLKDLSNAEQGRRDHDMNEMSARLYRFCRYSVVGTVNNLLDRWFLSQYWVYYLAWWAIRQIPLFVFACIYYVFLLPFHWWIANKYRDILETKEERRQRRKRAHLMLRNQSAFISYEYQLEELGLDEEELRLARLRRMRSMRLPRYED